MMHNPISPTSHAMHSLRPLVASGTSSVSAKDGQFVSYPAGQTVAHIMGLGQRAYIVTSGEIAIYVNGRPVDLVEAGEYFDESFWLGGEAVALTECTLRIIQEIQPSFF